MGLEERVAALRADRARGSGALADEALAILGQAAGQLGPEGFLDRLGALALELARARPAMVAIENRVHEVMAALHAAEAAPESLPGIARGLCEELRRRAPVERERAAEHAAQVLAGLGGSGASRVLTVSWSDTVAKALELAGKERVAGVVVPLGAPLLDGQRAAERLALAGLDVEVVPDAALGHAALACDAALVGADAVLGSGVVVNRAGTSLAALAIGIGGRPLWVACEQAKVTWRQAVPLEEGPWEDVWRPSPLLPVRVRHPLFDATPAQLVRGYCTEAGVLRREDLGPIAERHRARAGWLERRAA